jgi:hypothetical protein
MGDTHSRRAHRKLWSINSRHKTTIILAIHTLVYVLIGIAGLLSGFIVMAGMLARKRLNGWTVAFLGTTVATGAAGFLAVTS